MDNVREIKTVKMAQYKMDRAIKQLEEIKQEYLESIREVNEKIKHLKKLKCRKEKVWKSS